MTSSNYVLKQGVLLQAFSDASKTCTNANLTDELAKWHLKNNPACIKYFAVVPGGIKIPAPPKSMDVDKIAAKSSKEQIIPAEKPKEEVKAETDLDTELFDLKERLTKLKIKFHPLTGVVKLREKLEAALHPDNVKSD